MQRKADLIVYAACLRAYPRGFAREFGAEMLEVFSERVGAAPTRGARVALWARELLSLPTDLLRAWSGPGGDAPGTVAIVAAFGTLLGVSSLAARLVTRTGIFSITALLLVVLSLLAAGFLTGIAAAASRARRALLVAGAVTAVAMLAAAFLVDRYVIDSGSAAWALPGIRIDRMEASSETVAGAAIAALNRDHFTRVRTIITQRDRRPIVVRVLRTGGVDGLYILLALMASGAAALAGHRAARFDLTISG